MDHRIAMTALYIYNIVCTLYQCKEIPQSLGSASSTIYDNIFQEWKKILLKSTTNIQKNNNSVEIKFFLFVIYTSFLYSNI